MKYLIIPLLILAIAADVYCMWNWDSVSAELYYKGETIVYATWILAFLIYVKWTPEGLNKKIITAILLMFFPFTLNAIYRQFSGLGHEKSIIDLYTFYLSGIIVAGQIARWINKSINK